MARPSKILPKEDILRAMKMTRSNMAAARYLHVSYNHYKKDAKMYKLDLKILRHQFLEYQF